MRQQFVVAMVAIMLLAVLMVSTVMSGSASEDAYTTMEKPKETVLEEAEVVVEKGSPASLIPGFEMKERDYTYFRFTGNVTQLLNESHDGASWTHAFLVGDLDGDEVEDVLVQMSTKEFDTATQTTNETVTAKRGIDGMHLWEESVNGTDPFALWVDTVGDLDGDRKEDVLVQILTSEFDENTGSAEKATLIAKCGYDGKHLWEEPVKGTDRLLPLSFTTGDLDEDEKGDVLVMITEYDEFMPHTITETVIAKRGYDGKTLWKWTTKGSNYLWADPVSDLDGDGKEDVLVQTREYNRTTDTTIMKVIAKRGYDGTSLWEEESGTENVCGIYIFAFPVGDLDGDGKEDILVKMREYNVTTNITTETVIAKRGSDGTPLWEESVNRTGIYGIGCDRFSPGEVLRIRNLLIATYDWDTPCSRCYSVPRRKSGAYSAGSWSCRTINTTIVGATKATILFAGPRPQIENMLAYPVGDLNGDGRGDVLVLRREYDEATNTTTETVIAKRGYDGTYLWAAELTVTFGLQ